MLFRSRLALDLSPEENHERFLEGTGSIVIDQLHKTAYYAISERTDASLAKEWCERTGSKPVTFSATDRQLRPIYHTNVVMHIGNGFSVLATETIRDPEEAIRVKSELTGSGRALIELDMKQVESFAGNGLQLMNENGEFVYVLSKRGWEALREDQQAVIRNHTRVITPDLPTIETLGGGSARCMLAELFG